MRMRLMQHKKKKLCFVLPEYASATHFTYVAEFVEALAEEFDIFLIVEKGMLPATSRVSRQSQVRSRFAPLRILETMFLLLRARSLGFRIQYIHYSFVGAIGSGLITRLFGGRTLYWNCGMPWKYTRPRIQEWYEHLAFRLIHILVTGADALVSEYARYYGISAESIVVIPNWIDVAATDRIVAHHDDTSLRQELAIPLDVPILLFAHRLARRKGAHLLPDILAQVKHSDAILVVVGDGPERGALSERFRSEGLFERVRMVGAIPQHEVFRYLSAANIFLLPSEEEGFPHVLTEAMTLRVPYVASDVGGVREMTPPEAHSFIVSFGDIPHFAQAVDRLIADTTLRSHVGDTLRQWVVRYDKKLILERFSSLIRGIS